MTDSPTDTSRPRRPLLPLFPQSSCSVSVPYSVNDLIRRGHNNLFQLNVLRPCLETIPTSPRPVRHTVNLFEDSDSSLILDSTDEYDTDFEDDLEDRTSEEEEQRYQVDHLTQNGLEDLEIRVDDALSFVSNLMCLSNSRTFSMLPESSSHASRGTSARRTSNTGTATNSRSSSPRWTFG
jgi:hypothetical protein